MFKPLQTQCPQNMTPTLTKKNSPVANKYMETCSSSLVIREVPVKTTMRYNYPAKRMTKLRKVDNSVTSGCCSLSPKASLPQCQAPAKPDCSHFSEEDSPPLLLRLVT